MTSDGAATFRATGCGQMTGHGGAKFRGAVYFQTSAPSLMSVNGKCMVYEWDVDGQGNATWNIWEWIQNRFKTVIRFTSFDGLV